MGKILRIKNQPLQDILFEGIDLIKNGIITGFNFEKPGNLPELSLVVQYYHNVESHANAFIKKANQATLNHYGTPAEITTTKKWGVFKWGIGWTHEEGNRYFALQEQDKKTQLENIEISSVETRIEKELILAKDRSFIITFNVSSGDEALFLIDFCKKHAPIMLAPGILNPHRIDDHAYKVPLYILTDTNNILGDKADLDKANRISIQKQKYSISSLVLEKTWNDLNLRLQKFPCYSTLSIMPQFVSKGVL